MGKTLKFAKVLLVCCLCFCLSFLCVACDPGEEDGLSLSKKDALELYEFEQNNGEITIKFSKTDDEIIEIPSKIDRKPVTKLEMYAFSGKQKLQQVTIPANIKIFGFSVFSSCSNLQTVNFASDSQFESISEGMFGHCSNLLSITIPASVKTIDRGAFQYCSKLEQINFGSQGNLTTIGEQAFQETGLKQLTIPASVSYVGGNAFMACTSLVSVTIPSGSSLHEIKPHTFGGCTALTTVSFGADSNISAIGAGAFFCCNIEKIVIPNSVTSIGYGAFTSCTKLKSVVVPASVSVLHNGTFDYLADLKIFWKKTESPSESWYSEWKTNYNPTVYWYSENQPSSQGEFWHYVNGVATVWG